MQELFNGVPFTMCKVWIEHRYGDIEPFQVIAKIENVLDFVTKEFMPTKEWDEHDRIVVVDLLNPAYIEWIFNGTEWYIGDILKAN